MGRALRLKGFLQDAKGLPPVLMVRGRRLVETVKREGFREIKGLPPGMGEEDLSRVQKKSSSLE